MYHVHWHYSLFFSCRKIWEYFLEICDNNDSLHGIAWNPLKEQLDRAELTKSFVLNPLAPEFVPSRIYHTAHIQQQEHGFVYPGVHAGPWSGYPAMFPGQPFPQVCIKIIIKINRTFDMETSSGKLVMIHQNCASLLADILSHQVHTQNTII